VKLLLDTHAFVWWLNDSAKLSAAARTAISDENNDVFVSAATAWELATKVRKGKLPEAVRLVADFHDLLASEEFETLAVTTGHGLLAGGLAGEHNDPFDRMIAAQANFELMTVVTVDPAIARLGGSVIW
jgi:PIN domain nuclease of toxin-antitoxin system